MKPSVLRPPSGQERARILVADDGRKNLDLLTALLTTAGYEVVTARNGEEALIRVKEDNPDLVLLDGLMPKPDGYEACAEIKGNHKTRLIPVVILTSLAGVEERVRVFEVGADDFLRKPISRLELLARVRSLLQVKRLNEELVEMEDVLLALATAVETKDPYAKSHLDAVVSCALSLGQECGLGWRELRALRMGAILHDVGKIGIRESVLLKPGPLNEEEWEHIKTHPAMGERICQPLGREGAILEVVRHHHERYDGKGYPDGLAGQGIPLPARIMALADAFNALTSPRPYRPQGLSLEETLDTLRREAGKQFDPLLVERFIAIVEAGGRWTESP